MRKFQAIGWLICLCAASLTAIAQQNPTITLLSNPQNHPRNPDGSISDNIPLPNTAMNYAGDCTHTFTINPSPVNVNQDSMATVTFNVGALGGPVVADSGSLVPQSAPTNTAFNIHSGGFVEWFEGGPQTPFNTGTTAGRPYSRLTSEINNGQSQTLQSSPYVTGGCYVLTAVMQGDFKRNAQASGHDGSYRCAIEQTAIVQVSIPFTTLTCTSINASAYPARANLVAHFSYKTKGGEDLRALVKKIYGKHASAADIAKLYSAVLKENTGVVHDPHNLPKDKTLTVPDPTTVH